MERTVETIEFRGLSVTITSDGIYFTVTDSQGGVHGTIERPHRGQPAWAGYLTDGTKVTKPRCIGPRTALMAIANN